MNWKTAIQLKPDSDALYGESLGNPAILLTLTPTEELMEEILKTPVLDEVFFRESPRVTVWIVKMQDVARIEGNIRCVVKNSKTGLGEYRELAVSEQDEMEILDVLDERCREAYDLDVMGLLVDAEEWRKE